MSEHLINDCSTSHSWDDLIKRKRIKRVVIRQSILLKEYSIIPELIVLRSFSIYSKQTRANFSVESSKLSNAFKMDFSFKDRNESIS